MPTFFVVFSRPVVDQPDHPRACKTVEGLRVNAPDSTAACFHAARVTRGDGVPITVYDAAGDLVWGAGPESIVIPLPAPPLADGSGAPEVTQSYPDWVPSHA